MKTRNSLLRALLPVIAIIAYVLIGYFFNGKGWSIGWLVFLLIPVIESAETAITTKDPSAFSYPVFVTTIFLAIGLIFHFWHPTWVLFITIPAFYTICDYVKQQRIQKAIEKQNAQQGTHIQPPYEKTSKSVYPIIVSVVISAVAVTAALIIVAASSHVGNFFENINDKFGEQKTENYVQADSSVKLPTSDISNLEIEWISGNVKIEYYDGEKIVLEETGAEKSYPMAYKVEDGKLEVDEFYLDNISAKDAKSKDLTVKLPKDFALYKLEIEMASGKFNAKDINTTYFDFEAASGDCDVEFAYAPGKIELERVSGNVTVTLPEDATGYTVNREAVSGKFSAPDFDNALTFGDGSIVIEDKAVSGTLVLKKAD